MPFTESSLMYFTADSNSNMVLALEWTDKMLQSDYERKTENCSVLWFPSL